MFEDALLLSDESESEKERVRLKYRRFDVWLLLLVLVPCFSDMKHFLENCAVLARNR